MCGLEKDMTNGLKLRYKAGSSVLCLLGVCARVLLCVLCLEGNGNGNGSGWGWVGVCSKGKVVIIVRVGGE